MLIHGVFPEDFILEGEAFSIFFGGRVISKQNAFNVIKRASKCLDISIPRRIEDLKLQHSEFVLTNLKTSGMVYGVWFVDEQWRVIRTTLPRLRTWLLENQESYLQTIIGEKL